MAQHIENPVEIDDFIDGMIFPGDGYYLTHNSVRLEQFNNAKEMLQYSGSSVLVEGGHVSVVSIGMGLGSREHTYVVERCEKNTLDGSSASLVFDRESDRFYLSTALAGPEEGYLVYRGETDMTPESAIELMIQKGDWAKWEYCVMYMVVGTRPVVSVSVSRPDESQGKPFR